MEIHTLDRKQSRCDLVDYHLLQSSTFLFRCPSNQSALSGICEGTTAARLG